MDKLQPALRFPEFVEDWQTLLFKDVYSFRSTNSFSRDKLNYLDGEVLNLHYGDIHSKFNSLFDESKEIVPFINRDVSIEKISSDNYLKKGDLVIADASEDYDDIGKAIEIVNLNDQKILAGLHTFIARPDKFDLASGFGSYLMKTEKSKLQIKTIAQGTKVLSISATRLSDINISIPSLSEQTKIATFLSAVDEKLNLLKDKKTALEEYKKGMMQKIFSQEIRFKDQKGSTFPVWKVKNLGELSKLKGGYAFKSSEFRTSGIPVIRISNISNKTNFIDLNNVVYYAPIKNDHNFTLNKGDLLIAMSGATTGKSCVFNLDEKGYVNQRVGLFVNNDSKILHYPYLIQFVFSKEFFRQLDGVLVAGAQPNVSSSDIESFFIPYPSFEEQIKIASFLSAIDEKIILVSKHIDETQEYKKGLLQQMFC